MPPAIFSPILGLFGLGLAWRQGAVAYMLPPGIGEALLGGIAMLYAFCLFAYLTKLARRPAVLLDEVGNLPGRAGLAAVSISLMALAAVLAPYDTGAGRVVLAVALGAHGVLAAVIVRQVVTAPPEQRPVTPVWHLHFVGFIVGAVAAVPLGLPMLAAVIFYAMIPVAVAIWGASLWQFVRTVPPAPLRPLLAIHLAPASLFATVSALLGHDRIGFAFAVLAVAIFLALALSALWLCRAGFSPLWGSFTFPVAAFAVAMMVQATPRVLVDMMGFDPAAPFWRIFGAVAITLASIAVPYIAVRVFRDWARGTLASRTNAAVA